MGQMPSDLEDKFYIYANHHDYYSSITSKMFFRRFSSTYLSPFKVA